MLKQVSTVCASVTIASSASAGVVYGFSSITNNNAETAAAGEAQLAVELIEVGPNLVEFYFTNVGLDPISLMRLYWEDPQGLLEAIQGWSTSTPTSSLPEFGVDFSGGDANPSALPGSSAQINDYSIQVSNDGGAYANGAGPGEDVSVTFNTNTAYTELLAALKSGGVAVGGSGGGSSSSDAYESFLAVPHPEDSESRAAVTPTAAPSPTAALAGLGLLGLMATRRRRRA